MNRTYTDAHGCVRCTECLRPSMYVTPHEGLYMAAKRALKYLDAKLKGSYHSPNEDLACGRQLAVALAEVEAAHSVEVPPVPRTGVA